MGDKCPICKSDVSAPKTVSIQKTAGFLYSCKRCGEYRLDNQMRCILPDLLNNSQKTAILGHWIRTKYEQVSRNRYSTTEPIILTQKLIDDILKNPPPTLAEQADNIIRWLGSKAHGECTNFKLQEQLYIAGSATQDEFEVAIDYLIRTGLVKGKIVQTSGGIEGIEVALSFEGWQYYEKLKRGTTESRKAFMAMEYGDERLDKIVEEVLKLAVKQTGFDLFKLVDRPKAGPIDDRLRVEIQTSRFLIADLTHENSGAYWEAGYAEGLGKPVIYTCEKKKFEEQKTHFDTNHHLTIPWDEKNPEETAEKLKATIRATLPEQAKLTDD
jgi:hypothetical protein